MEVTLITKTENPISVCALAGNICRSNIPSEWEENQESENLVKNVLGLGHESIIEHAVFSVMATEVSRALTHQLVRHRLASYHQQSGRAVKISDNMDFFVVPPSIAENPEALADYTRCMNVINKTYHSLANLGIPLEDARFVYPTGGKTNILITMNARMWRHFFRLRTCNHAQWEIREMANSIWKLLYAEAPALFSRKDVTECGTKGECKTCSLRPVE